MRTICIALVFSTAVAAQCPFQTLSLQSYGRGCTTVFLQPTTLSGSLDPAACSLGLVVQSFQGCCNTFLTARLLAIGVQQTAVPLPQIGPGCTLLVDPVALLLQPAPAGDTFWLPLPATLVAPLHFVAQGAALYTTFGVSIDLQLTEGFAVLLQ